LAEKVPFDVEFIDLPGEEIPLEDNSVDTVLLTYTLCTIPGTLQAMENMRRVLKPGGKLIFSEHGKAPDAAVAKWQDRLNGAWGKIAGGCNMNREIPRLIEEGGFRITDIDQMYVPSTPKILGYTYWGAAEIK
jgi:ubiquinone/menaquinone biosynthesis C-methylase UbiE